jgi:hypothetical protein
MEMLTNWLSIRLLFFTALPGLIQAEDQIPADSASPFSPIRGGQYF